MNNTEISFFVLLFIILIVGISTYFYFEYGVSNSNSSTSSSTSSSTTSSTSNPTVITSNPTVTPPPVTTSNPSQTTITSNPTPITTPPSPPTSTVPGTVTGIVVSNVTNSTCVITWAAATNAKSYQWTLNTVNNPSLVTSGTTAGTKAYITGLTPNTQYVFSVRGANLIGFLGPANSPVVFTTIASGTTSSSTNNTTNPSVAASLPGIVQNIIVSNITNLSCIVTWAATPLATSYQWSVMNIKTDVIILTGVSTVTKASVTNLQSETQYSVAIQAVNNVGVGPMSLPVLFTTL